MCERLGFYHHCYTLTGYSLILIAPENCGQTEAFISHVWVCSLQQFGWFSVKSGCECTQNYDTVLSS